MGLTSRGLFLTTNADYRSNLRLCLSGQPPIGSLLGNLRQCHASCLDWRFLSDELS